MYMLYGFAADSSERHRSIIRSIILNLNTVMMLSFRTDRSGQTVLIQIRQSDQGLHCFPFRLHGLDSLFYGRAT